MATPARAGHELPFYPGYYPQEIRVETLTPAAAVPLLRNSTAPPGWPKGEPTSTYTWIDKTWPQMKA